VQVGKLTKEEGIELLRLANEIRAKGKYAIIDASKYAIIAEDLNEVANKPQKLRIPNY
jgi:hypothetical protein